MGATRALPGEGSPGGEKTRQWVNPNNDNDRMTIHDDTAQCGHGTKEPNEVCAECCTCNAHSGCECKDPPCVCPWGLPIEGWTGKDCANYCTASFPHPSCVATGKPCNLAEGEP